MKADKPGGMGGKRSGSAKPRQRRRDEEGGKKR